MMRDEYGRDQTSGIRALTLGSRVVKNGVVRMNGDVYRGATLDAREGQRLLFKVRDLYASTYDVMDDNWKHLGSVVGDKWVRESQRHRRAD